MKKSVTRLAFLAIAFSCFIVATQDFAAEVSPASVSNTSPRKAIHWNWLREADKETLLGAVPPMPLPGSEQDKADLEGVLKAQAARTPQDIEEAKADEKFTIELLTRVVGPDFTQANYPVTFDFLNRVIEDEHFLTSTLKERCKRPRPYQNHPEVKNLFTDKHYSYPSGHTAGSRILMLVLVRLFPDKASALLKRANTIAQGRVNAGVHYPSDIVAGNALAHDLEYALQDNPAFLNDLDKAKAEIAGKR